MRTLAELQHTFLRALAGGDATGLLALIDDSSEVAAHRLAIYRNNWRSNLTGALRNTFPVVERLVGTEFFGWLASQYIDRHPSRAGDLGEYGAEFPEFLREVEALAELPYMRDVAALEWAVDCVMGAPDSAVDLDSEGDLPAHMRLLASPYPVHRIWQVNQPEWQGGDVVSLEEGGVQLLIWRQAVVGESPRFELIVQPLSDEHYRTLSGP